MARSALNRDYWPVLLLIGLCGFVEIVLSAADFGLIGPASLRRIAYEAGGFWPGLLRGWKENFPGQAYSMFFTYSFLHGGLIHLAVNMLTLWSLGRAVIDRVGRLRFTFLYVASIFGGAVGYGLLAASVQPMVGASGALFGLAGGVLAWNYVDRFALQEQLWPVARAVLMLIALNAVLWYAMDGLLAWQTHLGGFVFGWLAAMLIDPRGSLPDED